MRAEACLRLLDGPTVAALLDPATVRDAVAQALRLHSSGAGRSFPVVREALATGGIFGIKSGDVAQQHLLGFKAAGFWPANRTQGGEPHQATIVLFDPASGRPQAVLDGNAITTARTVAAAVRPGTHINAVGADTRGKRELPEGLLARARLFVDDARQARQLGELQWAPELPCTEIGTLDAAIERAADAITVFDLTGLALQDLTVAAAVLAQAERDACGHALAWPW